MNSILTNQNQFSDLKDGSAGLVDPKLLLDIRFGNQRDSRDEEEFKDLVGSVKKHGVFTPVVVWLSEDKNKLELICGHGRRDAAIEANQESLPFIFREVNEQKAFEMHLAENLERESLGVVAIAKAIQHYLTLYKGDYEATASKLNLKLKECRELIELNKCSEKVLDAIKNKSITPAHAIILAPFPHVSQEKNLNTIISEKWTVKTLRERAGKAKLPLDKGVFDKKDCDACNFNTVPQLGLWGSTSSKAQCAKPICFQKKTTEYLKNQKTQLEEKHGKILLLSECDAKSLTSVNKENVGAQQFNSCLVCDERITVLNDSWSKAGAVSNSQCINKTCFSKCSQALIQEKSSKTSEPKKQQKNVRKTTENKLSPSIKTQYEKELRACSIAFYKDDENFNDSLVTASLVSHARFKVKNEYLLNKVLPLLLTMDNEQRSLIRGQAITHFLNKSESDANQNKTTNTLITCLRAEGEQGVVFAKEHWKPTTENLDIYTIEVLKKIALSIGIDKTMDAKEFNKSFSKNKADVIKFIQSANVEWNEYAPKNFTEILVKEIK